VGVGRDFRTQALVNTISEMGADRVMFAIDYPYEPMDKAASWFDYCPISEPDRLKIGRSNAQRLLGL
jgi:predicted TIM-barrel fold metal-dependent hydrolase